MLKLLFSAFVAATFLLLTLPINAQQGGYRLPDIRSMKHLTTRQSDHARNIPGKETTMDYYSAPNGSIVTIYSYLGKPVAFSTHSNGNYQGTYRLFMDLTGTGTFQEVNRAAPWELPAWTRR